jgi:exodeoxyribonuclease VII small subunit
MAERSGAASSENLPFEASLEKLEKIVDRLEAGEIELEEALAAFEEGVRLARSCSEQLERAERRVEILVQEGRELVARPFEEDA